MVRSRIPALPSPAATLLLPALFGAFGVGCTGATVDDSASPAGDADADTDADTDTDSAVDTLPPDPSPFTLTVSGHYDAQLSFDQPSCQALDGAPNFRAFWRNAAREHVFVLVADILGVYAGPGTYDETMGHVTVKLQEEAGGSLEYFYTGEGDTVLINLEGVTETEAWGDITVSGMQGDAGAISIMPQPIPIWCPALD